MDGLARVMAQLEEWGRRESVRMVQHPDLLRLESGGQGRAVVNFPCGFWSQFEGITDSEQESVLEAITLQVCLQFDSAWEGQFAKDIDIPMSLVEGRDRRAV